MLGGSSITLTKVHFTRFSGVQADSLCALDKNFKKTEALKTLNFLNFPAFPRLTPGETCFLLSAQACQMEVKVKSK